MSFLSENIIPGNHGKVFGTNAKSKQEMEKIKSAILNIDGIVDVIINDDVFPLEFTIHSSKIIKIDDIENVVIETGFHAIPKELFKL